MMLLQAVKTPQRSAGYVVEQLGSELLLYHPGRTLVVYLNHTAFLVWQLCDGHRSSLQIAGLLAAAFPDAASVGEDVALALDRLLHHGVLTCE